MHIAILEEKFLMETNFMFCEAKEFCKFCLKSSMCLCAKAWLVSTLSLAILLVHF